MSDLQLPPHVPLVGPDPLAPVVLPQQATAARGIASFGIAGAAGGIILAIAKHYGWEVDQQTGTDLVVLLGCAIHVLQHWMISEDPSFASVIANVRRREPPR